MEIAIRKNAFWLKCTIFLLFAHHQSNATLLITRHNNGDIFTDQQEKCTEDTCIGVSSGTAAAIPGGDLCHCRCHPHLPAFREDLRICVDDIHECVLAPFVGGSTSQQIPFIFLPLKGQIIHPSKEISFTGIRTPVCAVSGAKYLTESGWMDLRNPLDTDVPFRLFRDEGRTFLQWVGESDLRTRMSGRMVLVYLMCRDLAQNKSQQVQTLFSPCVAFRVVGTPSKHLNNVSEVAFLPDAQSSADDSSNSHLSITEYIAIGVCSVLLGLIYVASVFFYLHLRKRNASTSSNLTNKNDSNLIDNKSLANAEEGIIKNNPLLGINSPHFPTMDNSYSDSNSSDTDAAPDIIQHHDDRKKHHQMQITSALIHPPFSSGAFYALEHSLNQEATIERLPEENVSIVETLENREDHLDLRAITSSGIVRRKLYFNPAYFEPQLLLAPPPAALEFLAKIREVITIAKQKMASKRFTPTLLGIAEEELNYPVEFGNKIYSVSRRSSIISLKRENSRRKNCTGCPGCEPQDFKSLSGKLPEFPSLATCSTCTSTNENTKQRSIRKWLEDVPVLKSEQEVAPPSNKRLVRSPTHLPNFPDMINEAMAVHNKTTTIPTLTKKQMNAVINELQNVNVEFETDSLERTLRRRDKEKNGYHTPSEYAEVTSSQPSPSMSTALPLDEEMTMQNAIINKKTGSMTISKIPMLEDEHDYELIVMKKGTIDSNLYKLPELLQRNNGYALVSEVYVNNGYNYGSTPSTPTNSNCSTLENRKLKVRYEECADKPGKLLIEVEDCPDNYLPVDDSDSFEADTLDRKPSKLKISESSVLNMNEIVDSIDRPNQILLRTTGSFRNDSLTSSNIDDTTTPSGNFNRLFGSLREIYEAKTKGLINTSLDEEGRLLTLEARHSKRQRISTKVKHVQPDVIPPPPIHESIYEQPKPARKVEPAKNSISGSANGQDEGAPVDDYEFCILQKSKKNGIITNLIQTQDVIFKNANNNHFVYRAQIDPTNIALKSLQTIINHNDSKMRPEDSGYLSSDESTINEMDAQCESGAESVETHSVFFGRVHQNKRTGYGSMDSGIIGADDGQSSSDSETISYTTVVPNYFT